jgi:hypothetical protein
MNLEYEKGEYSYLFTSVPQQRELRADLTPLDPFTGQTNKTTNVPQDWQKNRVIRETLPAPLNSAKQKPFRVFNRGVKIICFCFPGCQKNVLNVFCGFSLLSALCHYSV